MTNLECVTKSKREGDKSGNKKLSLCSDKKVILYVIVGLSAGGVEQFLINLLKKTHDKYICIVLYYDGENFWEKELSRLGVKTIKLPSKTNKIKFIIDIIKRFGVNVVYACSYYTSVHAVVAAYLARVKIRIVHSHNSGGDGVASRIKRFCAKIIICSLSTDCLACSEKAGKSLFPWRKFIVINNGIELTKFAYDSRSRIKVRRELGISDEFLVIGMVGRLDSNKNQGFAIRIFEELNRKRKKYKIVIIGSGEDEMLLRNMASKSIFEKDIILIGDVKNVARYYNAFDYFMLTSLKEGFPYVLIEAQMNGLPIVVSSTVDKAVRINSNIRFLDLSLAYKCWAKAIIDLSHERVVPDERIKQYSIESTISSIEAIINRRQKC